APRAKISRADGDQLAMRGDFLQAAQLPVAATDAIVQEAVGFETVDKHAANPGGIEHAIGRELLTPLLIRLAGDDRPLLRSEAIESARQLLLQNRSFLLDDQHLPAAGAGLGDEGGFERPHHADLDDPDAQLAAFRLV